jgi:hypothetical protein
MKIKMILIIIACALALFLGFGLMKAKDLQSIEIIKTVTVQGTNQEVFDMVKS